MRPTPTPPVRLVLILGLFTVVGPLGIDMYLPAFPAIAASFSADAGAVQLSLVSYLLALSFGQAIWGPLADVYGRRRPLVAGLLLATTACLGAAVAPSLEALVVLRFCQGLGACAAVVIARSIARDTGEGDSVARLLATMAIIQGVSPMFAPFLGSVLLIVAPWPAIFLVTGALAATALFFARFRLPETLPEARRAANVRGAFARYLDLLRDRHFMLTVLANAAASGMFFSYLSGSPHVLITLNGMSPQGFGILFGANAMMMIGAAQVGARIIRRAPVARVLRVVSLFTVAATLLFVVAALSGAPPLWLVIALISAPLVIQGTLHPINAMRALSNYPHAAGAASAAMGIIQYASGSIASAIGGLLANDTAVPMAGMMALYAIACATLVRFSLAAERTRASV
ncbi:multidrug effflux MFS transporter [Acuticoccus kandeliae]|uniref:multidrug effflux MFS transporter n=1 Tax=Acuticoccus kandeliae TaxID=2073160 RepID=UPI000D3ECBFA|nr:multidrug effflux MFS transporter [Acuticoccus kandeliae]